MRWTLCLALLLILALPAAAPAVSGPPDHCRPSSEPASRPAPAPTTGRPQGARLDAAQVEEALRAEAKLNKRITGLRARVSWQESGCWQADFTRPGQAKILLRVAWSEQRRQIDELWTGIQIHSLMARGRGYGNLLTAWFVMLTLALLFIALFFDRRRPWRLAHLDLVMISAFALSQLFYSQARIDLAIPLTLLPLLYLLWRLVVVARRGGHPWVLQINSAAALTLLLGLAGLRIGLSVAESPLIDVGFASMAGAGRLVSGQSPYGHLPVGWDTYAPVAYLAYIPFHFISPWLDGQLWGNLPGAHYATAVWELLTLVGLFCLGRRWAVGERGYRLGLALALAWAACPYSAYHLALNSNDGLVACLLVWAMVARGSNRGFLAVAAGLVKFAPLAALPIIWRSDERPRRLLAGIIFGLGLIVLPFLVVDGPQLLWQQTLGFQLNRRSPFSIWGQYPVLEPLRVGLTLATLALIAWLTVSPPWNERRLFAAVSAVITAMQLTLVHWFYLYLAWIIPGFLASRVEVRLEDRHQRRPAGGAGLVACGASLTGALTLSRSLSLIWPSQLALLALVLLAPVVAHRCRWLSPLAPWGALSGGLLLSFALVYLRNGSGYLSSLCDPCITSAASPQLWLYLLGDGLLALGASAYWLWRQRA